MLTKASFPWSGVLASILFFGGMDFCQAQSEPNVQLLPPKTIVGLRSPLTIGYKRAYEASQKVQRETAGKAELVFGLRDRSEGGKSPLTVEVDYGDHSLPIALEADGTFALSPSDQPGDDARFVVNRNAGEVGVSVDIRPRVRGTNVSAADLRATIDAGRRARHVLLPWYARLMTPTVNSLNVCSQSGGHIGWKDENGHLTPLSPTRSPDAYGRPSNCVAVLSTSDSTSDASLLESPSDTTYDYVGSLF